MIKQLQTEKIIGTVVNNNLIILRAISGVTVDEQEAGNIINRIEETVPGDYSILVDRVNDYSITPVGVYGVLNRLPRLRAMAIVVHRPISLTVSDIEKSLSDKPFQVFDSLEIASEWLNAFFAKPVPSGEQA